MNFGNSQNSQRLECISIIRRKKKKAKLQNCASQVQVRLNRLSKFNLITNQLKMATASTMDPVRERGVNEYKRKVAEHREIEARLKESKLEFLWLTVFLILIGLGFLMLVSSLIVVRDNLKELTKQYDKSENDLKALQSVGQVRT